MSRKAGSELSEVAAAGQLDAVAGRNISTVPRGRPEHLFDMGPMLVEDGRALASMPTGPWLRGPDGRLSPAGLGVLLFGLSPLSVGLQRELFLDNFAVMWMLAALVLAASPRRHLWHHISSGLAAGAAVLSKETMLVALPALVLLLWQRSGRTTRKFSLVGFAAAFTLTVAQYPLYAVLKNELLPGTGHVSLWGGIAFQLGRAGSGSLLTSGTGSNQTLNSWLYYDHVLIVAGLVAAVAMSASRQLRAPALAVLLFAAVAVRPDAGYLHFDPHRHPRGEELHRPLRGVGRRRDRSARRARPARRVRHEHDHHPEVNLCRARSGPAKA